MQPVNRDEFYEQQSSRHAISWLLRDRRRNLDELFDAVEQETISELQTGERDFDTIHDRVLNRVTDRGRRGEFGGIITTIAIAIISQLIAAYIKKLIENWLNK